MTRWRSLAIDRGVIALSVLALLLLPVLFRPWVQSYDALGYYSWLRSAVIDGDLDTRNEWEHFDQGSLGSATETGYWDNPFAVGSAILWSPFFLVAHAVSLVGQRWGLGLAPDGYGPVYSVSVGLGSVFYAAVGILLTYRLARRFYAPVIATLACATTWLASTLVFYQYSHPGMSHANDAFAYALLLYAFCKARAERSVPRYAVLGMAAGLCALVRTQNAILVAFLLVEIAWSGLANTGQAHSRRQAAGRAVAQAAVLAAAWWLVFLPQVLVWKTVFGDWLPGNPYAHREGGVFDFRNLHLFGVLLSTNRGLFSWTPLVPFCLLGWIALWRNDRWLTAFVSTSFMLQTLVVAGWSSWSGGTAFGQRFFTNMVPALSLGLAALLASLRGRVRLRWLAVGCAFFSLWNGVLIARYALQDVPRAGPVPVGDLVLGQFTFLFREYARLVRALLTRS